MKAGKDFDVVVVGGGVGGVAAVRKLASAGLSVALVEDRLVAGECHYWGCNPSKTLLRPIEVFNLAKAVPGVREAISDEGLDVAAVFAKRDAIIEHLSDQDRVTSLRQAGVAVFHGFGRLSGEHTVRVAHADNTEVVLEGRHAVVLATGTRPHVPEIPGLAQARPWTNRDLTTMTQVPPRALVVGGGAVGVEFATILSGLGSAVTLLVRGNTLLPNCEPEARELVAQSLRSKGVTIHFQTELSAVARPRGRWSGHRNFPPPDHRGRRGGPSRRTAHQHRKHWTGNRWPAGRRDCLCERPSPGGRRHG